MYRCPFSQEMWLQSMKKLIKNGKYFQNKITIWYQYLFVFFTMERVSYFLDCRNIRHVSRENRPLQGSEHCYLWAVIAKVLQIISIRDIFLNGCWISAYFDTKFTAVVLIEPILHKFEDLKVAHFLNPKEVYFLVTRSIQSVHNVPDREIFPILTNI